MTSIAHMHVPHRASAEPLPARMHRPRFTDVVASACIVTLYAYLYLCMFFGAPFVAFDHENYIAFLQDPYPFFFEPGYTAVAFLLSWTVAEDARFALMFLLFTLPPFWLVWRSSRNWRQRPRALLLFAIILTKAFYIGFIAQRFFFAELWMAAVLIYYWQRRVPLWQPLLPGLGAHFACLSAIPTLWWFRSPLSWRKTMAGAALLIAAYLYLRLLSTFELFGYDYSRYLDRDETGIGLFSVMQVAVLAALCAWCVRRQERGNFLVLLVLILMIRVLFADIEVFSRVFQLQIDLVLLYAGVRARRGWYLLLMYAAGFAALQIFAAPRADEVIVLHGAALLNALETLDWL